MYTGLIWTHERIMYRKDKLFITIYRNISVEVVLENKTSCGSFSPCPSHALHILFKLLKEDRHIREKRENALHVSSGGKCIRFSAPEVAEVAGAIQ